jgi:hypothetical protein
MSWNSIQKLPDFSGWWAWQYTDAYRAPGPDGKPGGLPQMMLKAPMKPEIVKFISTALATVFETRANRKEVFGANNACLPPYFLGTTGGPYFQFEILFTPGHVTIDDEMGMVRHINLGEALPAGTTTSDAGTSVAHWEGDTLVVETTGINPHRTLFIGPFKIGRNIHVVERFHLKEPDRLEIAVELTAPEILTAPFSDTFYYQRDRNHVFENQSSCTESDRSIDHTAGKEQLDLTPPEDLPPPPAD